MFFSSSSITAAHVMCFKLSSSIMLVPSQHKILTSINGHFCKLQQSLSTLLPHQIFLICVNLPVPADEASTDGHLFALVHHAGGLAGHHPVLVVPPGLAGSALHPGRRQWRGGRGGTVTRQFDWALLHLPPPGRPPISQIYREPRSREAVQQFVFVYQSADTQSYHLDSCT